MQDQLHDLFLAVLMKIYRPKNVSGMDWSKQAICSMNFASFPVYELSMTRFIFNNLFII